MNQKRNVLEESSILSARDRFLEIGKKDLLTDKELWILVQANAQYLGLVEAHRELRKNVGKTVNIDQSQSSVDLVSALAFTNQLINIVGEGQDPVDIESIVLNGKSGESTYKQMTDSLSASISDAVEYRRISKRPHNWFLECGYHRLALPKTTKVLTYARELEWYHAGRRHEKGYNDCDGILLKAEVEAPLEKGVITRGERATVVKILECIDRNFSDSYITQHFNPIMSRSQLPELVGEYKETISRLWIDLKENPGSLAEVVKFMAGYERKRFMKNGGRFNRGCVPMTSPYRYVIPEANIFR